MLSFKEALKGNQHKIDKNKNGKIDKHDFKLLRKEEQEIAEATVKTQKYSWGTMKTVHHGSDFSIPLHPEHHQAIAKLKDEQEHHFKDETGRHWTARRKGDKVHFQGANNGGKTSVPHSSMKEEVELDEATPNKQQVKQAIGIARDKRYAGGNMTGATKAMDKINKGLAQHPVVKKELQKQNEETELDEAEKATGGLKDACWKGYTAVGMKMKNGKKVPNCVPVKEEKEDDEDKCEECGMPESECECDHEDDKKEMKEGKHVVGVTISDPGHSMVSQRNVKKFRKAKVTAPDKDTAINTALAYYKKRGYKVHDHNYVGLHNEEVEIEEGMQQTLRKYVPGYAKHQLNKKMDAQAYEKGDSIKKTVDKDVNYGRYKKIADKLNKEEVEQIDELSKSTLASYAKKSSNDARMSGQIAKDFENKSSSYRKPGMKSAAAKLAGEYKKRAWKREDGTMKAIDRLAKEEFELDEERINGREYASQGVMHPDHAKMDIHKVSNQHVDFYASKTGDKMQGKVVKNDGKSVHIQAHKELGDGKLHKFKVQRGLPKPTNEEVDLEEKMDLSKADMGDVIKDFKKSDAPQFAGKSEEKRRQMAIAAKLQADRAQKEEREVKSYKQFMEEIYNNLPELEEQVEEIVEDSEQLDEYESKGGRYVHKGSYGSSYQGDDDEDDDKPKKPASTEKRGRGRPKGASSGARQKGSTTGKKRTGVDYTGYPLHLPGNK